MFLRRKSGGGFFSITIRLIFPVVLVGLGLGGCGDSGESADLKESARQLSVAQNHILASHEQVALTKQEIAQANPSAKRQIESLATRLDGADAEETEAALAELLGMLEQLEEGDNTSLRAVSQGLIALSGPIGGGGRKG